MDKVITTTIGTMMLVALLANPAPVSVEFDDLILIALPFLLGLFSFLVVTRHKIEIQESNVLVAVLLYLSYLLFSFIIGLTHGISILGTFRALGPYINFFPLILLGFLPARFLNPWVIAVILISVGSLQAGYQIYLYVTHSYDGANTLEILRKRITLIEPRATLPIFLSVCILPMTVLASNNIKLKLGAVCLILFGLLAGSATLTRSIIISILIGWLTFILLILYYQSFHPSFNIKNTLKKFIFYLCIFTLIITVISFISKVQVLEQSILTRFNYHASSSDYSNGRLFDEWLPALNTWVNSGILNILFGIGAGNPFIVASGEERTYIHNLMIYSLVYGGIYGLFVVCWLYFTIFKTLIIRSLQSNQIIYLGFAALLISMFTYAQLFAVHKGLAFNAMLFLIITLALIKPIKAQH